MDQQRPKRVRPVAPAPAVPPPVPPPPVKPEEHFAKPPAASTPLIPSWFKAEDPKLEEKPGNKPAKKASGTSYATLRVIAVLLEATGSGLFLIAIGIVWICIAFAIRYPLAALQNGAIILGMIFVVCPISVITLAIGTFARLMADIGDNQIKSVELLIDIRRLLKEPR